MCCISWWLWRVMKQNGLLSPPAMELIPSLPATWGALPSVGRLHLRHLTPSFPSIVGVLSVLRMVWSGGTKDILGSQFLPPHVYFVLPDGVHTSKILPSRFCSYVYGLEGFLGSRDLTPRVYQSVLG